MSLLQKATNEQAYLKAGLLGFPGSGKSFTASMLAAAIANALDTKRPVAFFDTEAGSDFLIPKFQAAGVELLRVKSKAFKDLLAVGHEAEGACSVLIVDSITHVWNELCDAFLSRINEARKRKRIPELKKLEFQHWAEVKRTWAAWTSFYLNSQLHVIVCGRAGYEYEFIENDDTQKKELQKVGTKMRVEGEFGFEPSLLIEMERVSRGAKPGAGWIHRAHVLKDRTDSINGAAFDFEKAATAKAKKAAGAAPEWQPVYEAFKPVLACLNIGGAHISVDTTRNSEDLFNDEGQSDGTRRGKRVEIACEEIQGFLVALWPGQDATSKRIKADVLDGLFGTRSWAKVESQSLEELETAVQILRTLERAAKQGTDVTTPDAALGLLEICKSKLAEEASADREAAEVL